MRIQEFSIVPVLGRKTDVPANDPRLFKDFGGNIATHDVGGVNFDLSRNVGACTKAYGDVKWSLSANAQATKCLGLYELYDGTNRDHIMFDNGVAYVFDSTRTPVAKANLILPFDAGNNEPTIGETVEVTSGTWGGNDAAGNLYLSTSTGTWDDDTQLDGSTTGANIGTSNIPTGTSSTTFATDNVDLYSTIKVGDYMVFSDRGKSIPHKWKSGDAYLTPLDATGGVSGVGGESGLGYRFRYLVNFARRVVGLYCENDTDAPQLSIRWSSAWPGTSIANLNFAVADKLYIPNDDKIVGGATMGIDKCFIYCENSIQQLLYYANFDKPFGCVTAVTKQGGVNHHSIVNLGDRHFFFNRHYGFCEYRGGTQMPFGGRPISEDIETDLQDINHTYANLIVGTYVPEIRCCAWAVPMESSATPNYLLFYNIDTGQWHFDDKVARFVDYWQAYDDFTWFSLIRALGGMDTCTGTATAGTADTTLVDANATFSTDGVAVDDYVFNTTDNDYTQVASVDSETELTLDANASLGVDDAYEIGAGAIWLDAGVKSWGYYASLAKYLVFGNTDGYVYTRGSERLSGTTDLDGYRIEPIVDFGDPKRKDLLQEIWFQVLYYGDFDIHVWHRAGDTVATLEQENWVQIGTVNATAAKPVVHCSKIGRLHQIKWGTDSNSESFRVNKITFRYIPQSEN